MSSQKLSKCSSSIARREFLIATAAVGVSLNSRPLQAAPSIHSASNVREFGAIGDGMRNDTHAFAAALGTSKAIYVPAGVYVIDQMHVPSGSAILTDGFATVFQQRAGIREDVRLLNIIGSNVRLGDCTVAGNIADDSGEQRHGIFVNATNETGDLTNITIGNIRGSNLRGDVIYVGASDGRSLSDVRIGDVHGSNILRNVVSVVGGRRIMIGEIAGKRVGYMHLDIEPDAENGPVIGCAVSSVFGGLVQVAGQTRQAYVDRILVGFLSLNGRSEGSAPAYQPGLSRDDALEIRNVRSIQIMRLIASGYDGAAIRQVWNPDALSDQYLHIHEAQISNCCKKGGHSYIQGDPHATHLSIDKLRFNRTRAGVDVVRNCKSARIGQFSGNLASGTRLIARWPEIDDSLAYAAAGAAAGATIYHFGRRRWR